jgi:hypothetical protein
MGLGLAFLRDIIALKRSGLLEGYERVVEIGAQQIDDRLIVSPELDEGSRAVRRHKAGLDVDWLANH